MKNDRSDLSVKNLTTKDRFINLCHFRKVDRPPLWETLGFWPQTIRRWQDEGLPRDMSAEEFLGMEPRTYLPVNSGFVDIPFDPPFKEEVIKDEGEHVIVRDYMGIIFRRLKVDQELSMPQWVEFPVKNRQDWEKIKWRLDAENHHYGNWEELKTKYNNTLS